jgi:hypothetical protein
MVIRTQNRTRVNGPLDDEIATCDEAQLKMKETLVIYASDEKLRWKKV